MEHLLHEVVLVGVHHDVRLCLCLVAGDCHVADDGQLGKCSNVVMSLNLVTEELDEEEDACGDGKTEDKSDEHNHRPFGANLSKELRVVNEHAFVGCGCKRNRVFLALLEKHKVESGLHLLLATYLCKDALLLWGGENLLVVEAELTLQVVILYLCCLMCLLDGAADA